jgi:WD40 repeat protein
MKLHKVLIQSLSFSHDEQYLASLGGQDDNSLVIWEVSFIKTKDFSWRAGKQFAAGQ